MKYKFLLPPSPSLRKIIFGKQNLQKHKIRRIKEDEAGDRVPEREWKLESPRQSGHGAMDRSLGVHPPIGHQSTPPPLA